MNSNYEAVIKYCDDEQIKYRPIEGQAILLRSYEGDNGCYDTIIRADDQGIDVQTLSPVKVPQAKTAGILELLNLINQRMQMGYLVFCKGKICYRTNIIFKKHGIPQEVIRHLICANWFYTDQVYAVINVLLFGKKSPQDALKSLTNKDRDITDRQDTGSSDRRKRWGGRLGDIINN